MTKKLIALAVVVSTTLAFSPYVAEAVVPVRDELEQGQFCLPQNVDNATATAVISDASNAWTAVIVNNDSAQVLRCSERANTANSGANRGFRVPVNGAVGWSLKPGQLWYCINDGGAPVSVVVCKSR